MKEQKVFIHLVGVLAVLLVIMLPLVYGDDKNSSDILSVFVSTVKANPHNTNELYAAVEGSLYRSDNKGETWILCDEIERLGQYITSIAFDPVEKIVYVGTRDNLFMSRDGNNWVKLNLEKFDTVEKIFIQQTDQSKAIYLQTYSGFYISTVVHTWKKIEDPPFRFVQLLPVALDPSDPRIVYFAMIRQDEFIINDGWNGSGIYKSNNHGITLEKIVSARSAILLISSSNVNVMYGADRNIILKSVDGGATWKKIHEFEKDCAIDHLIMNSADHNVLYSQTMCYSESVWRQKFLLKSTDGGKTWQELTSVAPFINQTQTLLIDLSNPDILYIGTVRMGMFKSTDAGKTWKAINNGIAPISRKSKN